MNIFYWKSKKRKLRTKPTVEQEMKKYDLKLKKMAHKALVESAIENPEVKQLLIEREFGIKIPERDPLKEAKEKIHEVIMDKAADKIEHNPELVENLSQGLIKKYAEDLGIQSKDAPNTPFERALQTIEQYHQIKEGLGFKDTNSIWDTIKKPQVIVGFLGLAAQITSMIKSGTKPSDPIYVVTVDGKDKEMTKDEYTAYKQKGMMAKLTSAKAPHTDGALSDAAPKNIQTDDDQSQYAIQPLVYPTSQMAAQLSG